MATLASDELNRRLAKALKIGGDTHTIEDIQHAIARGEMQCFVHGNSFAITEIIKAPRKTYLNIFLVVGDLSITELHHEIAKFAKQAGCSHMQAFGRPGWKHEASRLGWKPEQVLFRYNIGQEI